jgi:hypothetical protein
LLKPFLKKSDAYRLYGRTTVGAWLKAGLIIPKRDGDLSSAWRLDRIELEALAKANNWNAYIPKEDR